MIPQLMPEEKNAPVLAGKKPRTKNGVGLFLQEYADHLEEIQRMIFEVCVVDDCQFRCCALQCGVDRGSLALIGFVIDEDPVELAVGSLGFAGFKLTKNRPGPVRGSIVHHNHFNALKQWLVCQQFQALEASANQVLLVIDGNKNRKSNGSLHG